MQRCYYNTTVQMQSGFVINEPISIAFAVVSRVSIQDFCYWLINIHNTGRVAVRRIAVPCGTMRCHMAMRNITAPLNITLLHIVMVACLKYSLI